MNRRYYVAPMQVVHDHKHLFQNEAGVFYQNLFDATVPDAETQWRDGEQLVLLCAQFSGPTPADLWHAHPDVAILPCPIYEGNDRLVGHVGKANRKFKQKHVDALGAIGIKPSHGVFDVEQSAVARNRGMRLRSVL